MSLRKKIHLIHSTFQTLIEQTPFRRLFDEQNIASLNFVKRIDTHA